MISHSLMTRFLRGSCLAAIACTGMGTASAQPATPHANQYGPALIGAPAAWAAGYTGQGVIVTVADSGIDPSHPAFAGKIDPRSRNYVLNAPGGAFNAADINDPDAQSHGSHVGGIVASAAASGVPGIAYSANLLVLRTIPSCAKGLNCSAPDFPNTSATALDYFAAQTGTMIYNASYGPDADKGATIWPTSMIDRDEAASAQRALAAGKIIVAANGNDRAEAPVAGANPNGLALNPFIRPGNANAGVYIDGGRNFDFSGLLSQPGLIIAVASVGQAKVIAPYSQTCGVTASWCVTAPGGDQAVDAGIYSTLPGNKFGYQQGTSMAAPTVSGALAVLQQAYSGYAARDLANVLFATAENIGGKAGVNATYGYGLIRLDRAIAGPTALADAATISIAAQQVTYWSQPLTTAGGFTVAGPGYLIIAGRTTATGAVAVTGGALGVDGTLTLNGGLNVAQGAMLAGFGRVIGNVTVNGTLNAGQLPNYADVSASNGGTLPAGTPLTGTSPGTLTLQGNVTLGATATMRANIDGALVIPGGPGTWDKIIVTGTGNSFTAAGTLAPLLRGIVGGNNNYSPAAGTAFAIVTAENGAAVTGQFTSLTQPAAGLAADTRLDVVYGGTSITLNVTPTSFQALAARENLSPNAQALAGALDAARPAPGTRAVKSETRLFEDLYDNSFDEDESELLALAGEGLAAHPVSVLASFAEFSSLLAARPAEAAQPWTLWAQGLGRWSSTGIDNGIFGASDTSSGAMAGVSHALSPDMTIGAAIGFSRTELDSANAFTSTDSYAGAATFDWAMGNWIIGAQVMGGPVNGHTTRIVSIDGVDEIITGTPGGWNLLGSAQAGYRFDLSGVVLQPYAGVTAQTFKQDGYGEASDIGLDFAAQHFSRVQTLLGGRIAADFDIAGLSLRPFADIAWTHDLGDAGLATHAIFFDEPFLIYAARPGRDAARVRAGFSVGLAGGFSLFAGYGGEFRGNATSHAVTGGLRLAL